MLEEINLELGHPPLSDAMEMLKCSITIACKRKSKAVMVIHGYGSSGKGGIIRTKSRSWLEEQLKKGIIKAVIKGEDYGMFDENSRNIHAVKNAYDAYYGKENHGITIVVLK